MEIPLISIIIPVYNDELYIEETIESCIKQTLQEIEIILVDDASTDETPKIIAKYAKIDSRIKTITHDKNEKTFAAIKDGVMLASGVYTVIISGDDTFDVDAMETVAASIEKNPGVDIVHFGRRVLNEEGYEVRSLVPDAVELHGEDILNNLFSPLGESRVNHQARKRSISVDIYESFFQNKKKLVLGEDQVAAFLYILRAKSYVGIEQKLYNYYFYRGNDGKKDANLKDFLEYRMNIIDSMDELERCLIDIKADGWVWERFVALRRHHYAWAVFVTESLSKKDRYSALAAWIERADATETLIGIALVTPKVLSQYMDFILNYKKINQNVDLCRKLIKTFQVEYQGAHFSELSCIRNSNIELKRELDSRLSIKRAARLTLGNIKRRIIYGKKR
jgi:glycosyltransferase involved in cell wall biosynthesis